MGARLKELLAQPDRVIRVFAAGQFCHAKLVELVGWSGGFDAVWLDHEHAGLSRGPDRGKLASPRGCGSTASVPWPPPTMPASCASSRSAGGVMASMVKNAGEVEELLCWASFIPAADAASTALAWTVTTSRLRWQRALSRTIPRRSSACRSERVGRGPLEAVEKIAAVPDLDFLFIGPADLSQSLGLPGEWDHPRVSRRIERVAVPPGPTRSPGPSCRATPSTPAAASTRAAGSCRWASMPGSCKKESRHSRRSMRGSFKGEWTRTDRATQRSGVSGGRRCGVPAYSCAVSWLGRRRQTCGVPLTPLRVACAARSTPPGSAHRSRESDVRGEVVWTLR